MRGRRVSWSSSSSEDIELQRRVGLAVQRERRREALEEKGETPPPSSTSSSDDEELGGMRHPANTGVSATRHAKVHQGLGRHMSRGRGVVLDVDFYDLTDDVTCVDVLSGDALKLGGRAGGPVDNVKTLSRLAVSRRVPMPRRAGSVYVEQAKTNRTITAQFPTARPDDAPPPANAIPAILTVPLAGSTDFRVVPPVALTARCYGVQVAERHESARRRLESRATAIATPRSSQRRVGRFRLRPSAFVDDDLPLLRPVVSQVRKGGWKQGSLHRLRVSSGDPYAIAAAEFRTHAEDGGLFFSGWLGVDRYGTPPGLVDVAPFPATASYTTASLNDCGGHGLLHVDPSGVEFLGCPQLLQEEVVEESREPTSTRLVGTYFYLGPRPGLTFGPVICTLGPVRGPQDVRPEVLVVTTASGHIGGFGQALIPSAHATSLCGAPGSTPERPVVLVGRRNGAFGVIDLRLPPANPRFPLASVVGKLSAPVLQLETLQQGGGGQTVLARSGNGEVRLFDCRMSVSAASSISAEPAVTSTTGGASGARSGHPPFATLVEPIHRHFLDTDPGHGRAELCGVVGAGHGAGTPLVALCTGLHRLGVYRGDTGECVRDVPLPFCSYRSPFVTGEVPMLPDAWVPPPVTVQCPMTNVSVTATFEACR